MADISKIKLPDNSVVNIKDARITGVDSTPTSGSTNVVTSGGVHEALAKKQATLVSGTNIKTINNTSLLGSGNMSLVPYDGVLMPTNPFGGSGVYINSIDNAFHSADKRFWVKITLHSKTVSGVSYPYADTSKEITDPDYWVDSPVINTLTNAANIFNGSYESKCSCPAGQYMKIHIQFSPFSDSWNPATAPRMPGYPYGSYYLSYYYQNTPGRASQLRVYNIYAAHTVGWHLYSPTVFSGSLAGSYIECFTDNNDYSRTCVEFIIYGQDSKNTAITQIDYKLSRPDLASSGSTVTKYADQSLYHNFRWYKHNDEAQPTNTITISPESGTITAASFIKSGGTSSQFLKADGSVDSNAYATTSALGNYLPLAGGQMNEGSVIKWTDYSQLSSSKLQIPGAILEYGSLRLIESSDGTSGGLTLDDSHLYAKHGSKTFTFPNTSGTLALTSAIPIVDASPTSGSTNAVSSGGVYAELADVVRQEEMERLTTAEITNLLNL